MEAAMLWSPSEYSVGDILQGGPCLSLPMIIEIMGEPQPNQQSPGPGEVYRFHSIASHQRAVCESPDGQLYSIPLEYPIKFAKPGGDPRFLSDLCKNNELPFDIVMEATTNQFKIGDETHTHIDMGQLTVRDVIQEKFIKANFIRPGYMGKAVTVFTAATRCQLRVAVELDHDQSKLGCDWEAFNRALDVIAKTVDFRKTYHYLDILQFTDTDLVSAAVQRKKQNWNDTERMYAVFRARTFATLVRAISGAGESSIAKNVQRVIKEESVYSSGLRGRSGPDSGLPSSTQTYDNVRGVPGAGECSRSVAIVRPSTQFGTVTENSHAEPMGGARGVQRPRTQAVTMRPPEDRGTVYEQIDTSKMDAGYTASVFVDDEYLTPCNVESLRVSPPPRSETRVVHGANRHTLSLPATPLDAVTSQPEPPPRRQERRPSTIEQPSDIPEDVESLTKEELVDCMMHMNLDQYCTAEFLKDQIDGKLLLSLTEDDLKKAYDMNGVHAKKLCQFAKTGWRPK